MLQHMTYAINEEKHLDSQATQSGSNSQTGTQNSVTGLGQEPPPPKRLRKDDSDVKEEDKGEESGALVPLSEVVSQARLLFSVFNCGGGGQDYIGGGKCGIRV